ncbi:MAG: magnesium/cobalt transporter CorA [Bacteroidetes bacterium]|nr:magnesium/cobalt transporter CorA [Bacteroidota bacterium]
MKSAKKKVKHTGQSSAFPPELHLTRYCEAQVEELKINTLDELTLKEGWVHWVNIVAPDKALLLELAKRFELHPLARDYSDVAGKRPALYEFDNHMLVTARTITLENSVLRSEIMGLVIGPGYVLTLQEDRNDPFDSVRNRIREKIGWIRMRGSDHLFYRLLDAITEEYFLVAEHQDDDAESLMDTLEAGENPEVPAEIRQLRQSAVEFRKAVTPLRDVLAALLKSDAKLLTNPVRVFLRDVHQQSIQLVEVAQAHMDQIKEIQDRHHLLVNERMNATIKVLTVVTAFFIPLTFLVGVYGMNFDHMPELSWDLGYPLFWLATLLITGGMYWMFKRKKWF